MDSQDQSHETPPRLSGNSSRTQTGLDGRVDTTISSKTKQPFWMNRSRATLTHLVVHSHELLNTEVAEHGAEPRSDWMSWESLEQVIKQTFVEADRLIAHDSKKCQHRSNSQTKKPRCPQSETTPIHTSPANGCDKAARDIQVFRRPQHDDEYWSVSSKAWSKLSEARREVLCHVGRINETSDGQEAPGGDCKKCIEGGWDCMVYCEGASKIHHLFAVGSACSRCRYRGLACSFDVAGKAAVKKRKAGCNSTRPRLAKKTRLQ